MISGEVGVVMFNLSQSEYKVAQGDRIAQLVLERILTPPVIEVPIYFSFCFFANLLKFEY